MHACTHTNTGHDSRKGTTLGKEGTKSGEGEGDGDERNKFCVLSLIHEA